MGASAFSGPALTYGFQIAFYVLAGLAALGAVLSAVMLEPGSPESEVDLAPEGAVELEAAA